jgi:hypothetical protein
MLMRFLVLMAVLLMSSWGCEAETLRDTLLTNHIPTGSFVESELAQRVNAEIRTGEQFVLLAYQQLNGETPSTPLQLVRYSKGDGAVTRSILLEDQTDVCSGSLAQINFVGEFTLVSTKISQSAECVLVLGRELELIQTLYGFRPLEIAPGQVVLVENMIDSSPVRPERLQWADLNLGTTAELYPPQGDEWREQLGRKQARHIPQPQACTEMNEACASAAFDEEIRSVDTDGKGRLSFVAVQSAGRAGEEGKASKAFASQAVVYVYAKSATGWMYCAKRIEDSEGSGQDLNISFASASARCTPKLPVLSDTSTSMYNPFYRPENEKE